MSKSKKTTGGSKRQVSCAVHDITIFDEDKTVNVIRDIFSKYCKKYCFQTELGEETKKKHYQCRISLKMKCRQSELINKFKNEFDKFHISITSNANKDNDFYVMKEETRLEGPFTDMNYKYIPRDVRAMATLRPWQGKLRESLKVYNERQVDVIIDPHGNIGKTRFTRYMECYENAETIDFCNDYKDLMRMAYDLGVKDIYMIDIPRAISKDKLFQFYGAIETLKSGKCFDDRYGYRKRLFDPPRVVLFCNKAPDFSLLSKDMWKCWRITKNHKLIEYAEVPE